MSNKKKIIDFLCSTGGRVVLTVLMYVFALLFMSITGMLADNLPQSETVEIIVSGFSLIVVAVWTIFGWKSLSAITPNVFLIMPIVGWVAYFIVKGLLSVIVGIFVGPYQIAKSISNYIQRKY